MPPYDWGRFFAFGAERHSTLAIARLAKPAEAIPLPVVIARSPDSSGRRSNLIGQILNPNFETLNKLKYLNSKL